jgi:hypothetical protein
MPLDMRGILQLVQQNPQLAQMLFEKMKELQTTRPPDEAEPDFPTLDTDSGDAPSPYGEGYREGDILPGYKPEGLQQQPLQGPRPRLDITPEDQRLLIPGIRDARMLQQQDEHYNEAIAGPDYEDI